MPISYQSTAMHPKIRHFWISDYFALEVLHKPVNGYHHIYHGTGR
jgi:hypothetical protein